MEEVKIKIKRVTDNAKIPTKSTKGSAGYDLYALLEEKIVIKSGETCKVRTGMCIEIPDENWVGLVFARSGLSTKFGVSLINAVGVIDSDYRGEIIVALHNFSQNAHAIEPYDRIVQLLIVPLIKYHFEEVCTLGETKRGANGFGSTGIK